MTKRQEQAKPGAPAAAQHKEPGVKPAVAAMDDPSTTGKEVVTLESRLKGSTEILASKLDIPAKEATKIISRLLTHISHSEQMWKFERCTQQSFFNAIQTAYDLHLPIDGRKLVHLIPYEIMAWDAKAREKKGTGKFDVQLQIGKGAYINVIKREYPGAVIHTGLVWPDDVFDVVEENGEAKYTFKPKNPFRSDFANLRGAFCYICYQSHGRWFSVLVRPDKKDIDKARGAASDKSKAWLNWYGEMAQKFAIKRAGKPLMDGVQAWSDLETADNEQYDLEKGGETAAGMKDVTPRSSRAEVEERLRREEESAKAKVTDATVESGGNDDSAAGGEPGPDQSSPLLEPTGREGAGAETGLSQSSAPPPNAIGPDVESGMGDLVDPNDGIAYVAAEADQEAEHSTLLPPLPGEAWDGRTVMVGDKATTQDFPSAIAAGRYLERIVANRQKKSNRQKLIDENMVLMHALATSAGMSVIDSLTKLIIEGEADAD